jgi:hypothetical protein
VTSCAFVGLELTQGFLFLFSLVSAQSDMAVADPRLELEYKLKMEKKSKNVTKADVDRKLLHPTDPYSSTVGLDELMTDCSVRQKDGAVLCRAKTISLPSHHMSAGNQTESASPRRRKDGRLRKRRHRHGKKR